VSNPKRITFATIFFLTLLVPIAVLGDSQDKTMQEFNRNIELLKRYLDVIHLRYTDEKGQFSENQVVLARDAHNINYLYKQVFKVEPLQKNASSGNAETVLNQGINKLKALSDRMRVRKKNAKFEHIPLDGENNPELLHVGTLTRVNGAVELLTHPSPTIQGNGLHVKFEGKYYLFERAKPGDKVHTGEIIRVSADPGSSARLIFNNGDHFDIGKGTAFLITDPQSKQGTLELSYGQVRTVLEKYGVRRTFKVRTKSAIIGVRGTDFFVNDKQAGMSLVVMRGRVRVAPKHDPSQALDVIPGMSAVLPAVKNQDQEDLKRIKNFDQSDLDEINTRVDQLEKKAHSLKDQQKLTLIPTTQDAFETIEALTADSKVPQADIGEDRRPISARSNEERLEMKAFQMVLKDLLEDNPETFDEIMDQKIQSLDELNRFVVKALKDKAPN